MKLQGSTRPFLKIQTVFDGAVDQARSLLYNNLISTTLTRLLPPDFFFFEDIEEGVWKEIQSRLPLLRWTEWGESSLQFSIVLVNCHRMHAAQFFYEMVSRWLLPGRRLESSSFFTTDFKFPEVGDDLLTFSEMVISLSESHEVKRVRQQLPILEAEIRLGLVSVYHASRILEGKGLSGNEKTTRVQERIASFLKRRPSDFDSDIFSQMQHFLVMCTEEFKLAREYRHMSRIVYVFYVFRRALRQQMEEFPTYRHLQLKLSRAILQLPFGSKRVLSVFVGMNFLNENEVFEQRHLLEAIRLYFPEVCEIEGSYFADFIREEGIQLLYLEVEKPSGCDFSSHEIGLLRERLADDLKSSVEKLMRPLYMPRNEEEVMRNIITLSQQLKYPRDLAQVIISFEGQSEQELCFTIVFLRLLAEGAVSLQELFQKESTFLKFIPDRVKTVGMLRKKYVKEATVFRVTLPSSSFLRQDHSVDLLKARQAVMAELQRIVGEVRDYNGGMIAKQHEQFLILKNLCAPLDKKQEVLLERFFQAISPVELRSVVSPVVLKNLFRLFLATIERNKELKDISIPLIREDVREIYFLLNFRDPLYKEVIAEALGHMRLASCQLVSLSLQIAEQSYLGFILQSEDTEQRACFLQTIQNALSKK